MSFVRLHWLDWLNSRQDRKITNLRPRHIPYQRMALQGNGVHPSTHHYQRRHIPSDAYVIGFVVLCWPNLFEGDGNLSNPLLSAMFILHCLAKLLVQIAYGVWSISNFFFFFSGHRKGRCSDSTSLRRPMQSGTAFMHEGGVKFGDTYNERRCRLRYNFFFLFFIGIPACTPQAH